MEIEKILKESGKSITQERISVAKYIQDHHLCDAQSIIQSFPIIGRASIFRTLKLFCEIGLVRRITLAGGKEQYEFIGENTSHHEHISCERCGSITPIESKTLCEELEWIGRKLGYSQLKHFISLSGICKKCEISPQNSHSTHSGCCCHH